MNLNRSGRRLPLCALLALGCVILTGTPGGAAAADLDAVRDVFDRRCVACHSCYNAPCQLDLSSWAGVARGATSKRVYDSTRIRPVAPTRLFVDARTAAEWHTRNGFYPVTGAPGSASPAESILGRMLALKRRGPARVVRRDHAWMCPRNGAGFAIYSALGHDGMPHGFPPLDDAMHSTLTRWLEAGAPVAAIPARARYRFFLDNARYFVMSFIRGPVCEGQMAVNVINDHFHVLFLDPDHDLSVTDPAFLDESGELLALPATGGDSLFRSYFLAYKQRQRDYTAYRERRYAQAFAQGMAIDAMWNGNQVDQDAMLTVFRHFDNASVVHGARGGTPKTVWVIDYPIFERIYYLLVAGFDVYGNAFHQAATRLYMDNLRIESEDLFLSFLPPRQRVALRDSWYRGMLADLKMDVLNPLRGLERGTRMAFASADPKRELISLAIAHLGAAAVDPEPRLNVPDVAGAPSPAPGRPTVERMLNRLTGKTGGFVAAMPDLSYLLVQYGGERDLYALIRNQAHTNVAFVFDEEDRHVAAEDTLSVLRGVAGSYPNFMLRMTAAQVPDFVALLEHWDGGKDDLEQLRRVYGVSRTQADFWAWYDVLDREARESEGVAGARLDLGKYRYW